MSTKKGKAKPRQSEFHRGYNEGYHCAMMQLDEFRSKMEKDWKELRRSDR